MTTKNTKRQGSIRPPKNNKLLLGVLAITVVGITGGAVWVASSEDPGSTSSVGVLGGDYHALRVLPDGKLLYGEHAGVSISEDGGRTWSESNGIGDAMAISTSPVVPEKIVMAGHDVFNVSEDGGETWRKVSFGNLPGTDIHGFTVAPSKPHVWYANIAGRGLYRSENAQDWQFLSSGTASAMSLAAGPGETPRLYALTMNQGLIVSDDGVRWMTASEAPPAAAAGLDVHPVSGNVYIAGPNGVARSENKGATWQDLSFPEGARLVTADPQDEQQLFAVGESGRVQRSTDGGSTWIK
ncbi:WD40/YVTN/BNR-like repeat-containing protein [Deinococcus peraridilitoris]|uniref:BNR/Asp-box repeat protein n=1 Tax=Deinococcus peraridilitoris (strain DSM 19664 / LMG 22246 / CIP 109416 / KR-200) TaxID=937777 RepID=L0A8H3_DEIPD|nr:sialidase family protein [Deinococcus peraridilitoris]AFZ69724.1 BNR/Asp-box repeat protein [Deinococcus peraridilitoris DSM 19664]